MRQRLDPAAEGGAFLVSIGSGAAVRDLGWSQP